MACSAVSVLRWFFIFGLLPASVKSQGHQTGSYYQHDLFYSSGVGSYHQQVFNPHPDPAIFSPAAYPYPSSHHTTSNYHNPNPIPSYPAQPSDYYNNNNYYNPNTIHNPNYYHYNSNPYPYNSWPNEGYVTPVTDSPPTTTTESQPNAVPSSSGGEEQPEMDEESVGMSGGGGPVFNSQAFLGPQQALPAWPFQAMSNTNSQATGLSGSGRRLFLLPPAVGGQGLLEAVASAQRHRQRSSRFIGNRNNNLANNPLLLMLALSGFS